MNVQNNEIGIKLRPDFAGVPQDKLYQLDIVVKNVQPKELTPIRLPFKFKLFYYFDILHL